jgi:membrane-bound serine protease (ClpP class)
LQNIFEPHVPKLDQGGDDLLHRLQQRTFIVPMKTPFRHYFLSRRAAALWVITLVGGLWGLASAEGNAKSEAFKKPTQTALWAPTEQPCRVYRMDLLEPVDAPMWRRVQLALQEADQLKSDLVFIRLNTYGGRVDYADSIRTRLLQCPLPVVVWIDNNAASAGALIALAANRIYMNPSASMGAATVVNQQGEAVPDKYQSYMRATMRATAQARQRNPRLAECMVDPDLGYPGVVDSGKVLTLTASEAEKLGMSDGTASNAQQVLRSVGVSKSVLVQQKLGLLDRFLQFLLNPAVQSILILLMLGGLYLELQSPGIGLPIVVSVLAAALYFAPLYLEGLATYAEIWLFVAGLLLLALEIWVLPGTGWAGALGLAAIFLALVTSMLDNNGLEMTPSGSGGTALATAVLAVLVPLLALGTAFLLWGERLFSHGPLRRWVLKSPESTEDASTSSPEDPSAVAHTRLIPAGKILYQGRIEEAHAVDGWIEAGTAVRILRREQNRWYVQKAD